MQQTSAYSDTASPYMLWQYVHLMTPAKTSEYALHPAFTHTNALTAPHMGYFRDQFVGNANYHHHQQQQQQFPQQHLSHKENHYNTQIFLNDQLQNLYHECPRKMKKHDLKNFDKTHFDRNANIKTIPDQMLSPDGFTFTSTPKSLSPSSPRKGSSFTIDAILSKDQAKSAMEVPSPTSVPVQSPSNTESCQTIQNSMSSTSPGSNPCSPSKGRLHAQQPTPNFETNIVDRRHGRFLEVSHPYFLQQYDGQQHHLHSHSPRHPPFLTSSSGSSSASSSASTSPENNSGQRNDKAERKTGGKSKRIRTIFTPEQLERLEAEFERQQYMVGTERYYLAASLNLTEAQVKVWFQNRRIKWRKQHLEQQQARLAQGDLYRDLDEESESETEDQGMNDTIDFDTNMNLSRSVEDSMPVS